MRIVCLAWGSLIWKPGDLQLVGQWQTDGPSLPIEFARVGDLHELATTICDGSPVVPVHWARLSYLDLASARDALRRRERIPADRPTAVGSVVVGTAGRIEGAEATTIARWAETHPADIEAVVWTALPPRYDDVEGQAPTASEAASYLASLRGEDRDHAEDYVRRVPERIRTVNRTAIEAALGWLPMSQESIR